MQTGKCDPLHLHFSDLKANVRRCSCITSFLCGKCEDVKDLPHLQALQSPTWKLVISSLSRVEDSHKPSCLANQAFGCHWKKEVTQGSFQMWKQAAAWEGLVTDVWDSQIFPHHEKKGAPMGKCEGLNWMPRTYIRPDMGTHICKSSGLMWDWRQERKISGHSGSGQPWGTQRQTRIACLRRSGGEG